MLQIPLHNDEGFMADLCINNLKIKRYTPLSPTKICVTHRYSPERRRIERFIEQTFLNSYNAHILYHYPSLMSVHDEEHNILAALGFRYAKDEPLFLESYLDYPIETILEHTYHQPISRNVIAEIGNLASNGQGASIFLFTALNAYLAQQGIEINTVTATDFLSKYFRKLGLKETFLAHADKNRLYNHGVNWGSYYDENPRVIAGDIHHVLQQLKKHLHISLTTNAHAMYTRIYDDVFSHEGDHYVI